MSDELPEVLEKLPDEHSIRAVEQATERGDRGEDWHDFTSRGRG